MRSTRRATIATAATVAVSFVLLRVVYRIVFGGADGAGVLLWSLPTVRLGGPFSHIVLFGDVTSGGLSTAAVSALPFAALILALGVCAALIDLRALVAAGAARGPVRTLSRALVVAGSTIPALIDATRRARVAQELRGDRPGPAVLVPVLERTVERAITLGASMELRGFAATRRAEPVCERPAELTDVALGYGDARVVREVSLDVVPGTLSIITGPTGSGKSTILASLSGILQHLVAGEQDGVIRVIGHDRISTPPRETAGAVGVVAQNVRAAFVGRTVAEEIGFALSTRGVAPVIVAARVADVASRLGIDQLVSRELDTLSAGEAQLVAIAAAVVDHPVLLLVDEPLADLDRQARPRVVTALERLAREAGIAVVVVEHTLDGWRDVDAWFAIEATRLRRLPGPPPARSVLPTRRHPTAPGATVARARDVTVRYGDLVAVDRVDLDLASGEIVALCGPNGAGKSSLLDAIARPRARGQVLIDGRDVRVLSRRERRASVALVPERVEDLFVTGSVAAECARADRIARDSGPTADSTVARFARLLGRPIDAGMTQRHPRDLSAGERLCLAIALQTARRPRVLLLDEPSRGLDGDSRSHLADVLTALAEQGTAIVVATHDEDVVVAVATRRVDLDAGRARAGVLQ
jgi:energy-coupling factor transport system ATP-binding protein